MDAVKLISRIMRQGVFFCSSLSLVDLWSDQRGREFIFIRHSLCPINPPKDPKREGVLSILRRELRPSVARPRS